MFTLIVTVIVYSPGGGDVLSVSNSNLGIFETRELCNRAIEATVATVAPGGRLGNSRWSWACVPTR